jgi:hypothetical protein
MLLFFLQPKIHYKDGEQNLRASPTLVFSYSVVQYNSSGVAKASISLAKEALGHVWAGGGNIGDLASDSG